LALDSSGSLTKPHGEHEQANSEAARTECEAERLQAISLGRCAITFSIIKLQRI
jgi:hypothetical protein